MKAIHTTWFVASTIVLSASITASADEPSAASAMSESEVVDRMCLVSEEIRHRRAQRAALMEKMELASDSSSWSRRGAVYQPRPLKSGNEPVSFTISDLPLDAAIAFYACLAGREVMVSARIADKKLTVSADKASRAEAVRAFDDALSGIGVRIVAVDQYTVVLLEREQ